MNNQLQQLQADIHEKYKLHANFGDYEGDIYKLLDEAVSKGMLLGLTVAKDCIPERKEYDAGEDEVGISIHIGHNTCRTQTETAITREIDKVQGV